MSFRWNLSASEFTPSFSSGLNAEANEFNPFAFSESVAPAEPVALQKTDQQEVPSNHVEPVVVESPPAAPAEEVIEVVKVEEQVEPVLAAEPVQETAEPELPVPEKPKTPDAEPVVTIPPTVPEPENPPSAPSRKVYLKELLLELKETCKALPPGADIPEGYNVRDRNFKGGKKGKKSRRDNRPPQNPNDPPVVLLQSEDSFMKKVKEEKTEDQKIVNKLRFTLNRLSDLNFDKLTGQLLSEFNFEGSLLKRLVQFIFELATAHHNYAELYARLCTLLRKKFWDAGNKALSKEFRAHLLTHCEECFYSKEEPLPDSELMDAEFKRRRRLMGNIKFIALLFKEKFMKNTIMHECFTVLLEEKNICDESIETFCALFTEVAPGMPEKTTDPFSELQMLETFYEKTVQLLNDPRLNKRTYFLIQDLIDDKARLLGLKVKGHRHIHTSAKKPAEVQSPSKPSEAPRRKDESASDSSREEDSPSKLSQLATATKANIHKITRHYAADHDLEEASSLFHKLMEDTDTNGDEVVHQILKYTLCELSVDVHSSMCLLLAKAFAKDAYDGFVHTVQGTKDLELDCPMAAQYLERMITEVTVHKIFTQDQTARLDSLLRTAIAASPLASPAKVLPPASVPSSVLSFDSPNGALTPEQSVLLTQSRVHLIVRSYSESQSLSDAVDSVLETKASLRLVVEETLKYTLLELSANHIPAVCGLVGELVKRGVGSAADVREGVESTIRDLEELTVDCPKAPKYLREVLSALSEQQAVDNPASLLSLLPS